MRREHFAYQYADEIEADAKSPAALDAPLCEADAEARGQSLAEDAAERAARVAARHQEDRAALRAACATNHEREVREAASRFRYALAAARRDGFDVPHRDEISELMSRTVIKLREQQEAV